MAAALQQLATDPASRALMGQLARERIVTQFNAKDQIKAFIDLFSSVAVNR
jgi:glycosyltransferase involved in cell wall biosynthesis